MCVIAGGDGPPKKFAHTSPTIFPAKKSRMNQNHKSLHTSNISYLLHDVQITSLQHHPASPPPHKNHGIRPTPPHLTIILHPTLLRPADAVPPLLRLRPRRVGEARPSQGGAFGFGQVYDRGGGLWERWTQCGSWGGCSWWWYVPRRFYKWWFALT